MGLPLPSRLTHRQGCLFAAGHVPQAFAVLCSVLVLQVLTTPTCTPVPSHVAHVGCCQQHSGMCPGHFRHRQAVVLANSLENGDVPELVFGSCPIYRKKLVFLTLPLCQDSFLSGRIAGVFGRDIWNRWTIFPPNCRTGHGFSWPEARPHVLQCFRGQPTTCQINGPGSLCNDLLLTGSYMAILS